MTWTPRRLRWLSAFVVGLLLGMAAATSVGAQTTIAYVRPDVRASLAAAWDDTTATQRERAYCALYRVDSVPKFRAVVFTVFGIVRAIEDTAAGTGYVVRFACPPVVGAKLTSLHTHPPTTCTDGARDTTCVIGGADAYQCDINSGDSASYRRAKVPFALVQCDRNALVPYFDPGVTSSKSLAPAPHGASRLTASRYALLGGVVLGGVLDRDRGGYREPWNARGTWTGADKQAHAGVGFGLGTLVGARWGCASAALFEGVQAIGGKGSVPDALVTCAGAVIGSRLARWVR